MIDFDFSDDDNRSDVLSKADEFIKRRRKHSGSVAVDLLLDAEPADDIPLLTEVVADANLPTSPAGHRGLSAEIARELDAWLDENLPQVVVHVMDGITDKLIQQIHASAREDLLPRLKRMLRDDAEAGEQ